MFRITRFLTATLLLTALALLAGCDESDDAPAPGAPAPVAESNTRSLGTIGPWGGAYPSDMVLGGDTGDLAHTLFVTDEATVDATGGARILALDLETTGYLNSTVFSIFTLDKTDLLQNDGSPVDAGDTFGAMGGSDPSTDQVLILSETRGLVLTSAGSETHASTTGFVACLTLFDPTAGTHTQTINLGLSYTPSGSPTRSDGTAIGSFEQSNPSGVAFVSTGSDTGKIYVSMSNLYEWPWGAPPVYNPGTVQVFDVDFSAGTPIDTTPSATILTTRWNPVHVTLYHSADTGTDWVLATNAGIKTTSGLPYESASFTVSSIDVLNTVSDNVRATIGMGLAALSFNAVAIGKDGTGRTVGLIGSTFFGNLYAVDLSGLDEDPEDVAGIRALRSAYNPIQVFHSDQGDAHTWGADVALSPNGAYAFVTAYNQAEVHVVLCPGDWETGRFEAHPRDFKTPFAFTGLGGGTASLSRILIREGTFSGPDVLVLQSDTPVTPASGNEYGAVGTIDTHGRTR